VDYDHNNVKELGEIIGNKFSQSESWMHPVRILLLERDVDREQIKLFCSQHREILKNNIRYTKETESLQISGLNDEHIEFLINQLLRQADNIDISTDQYLYIKNLLKEKGYDNRPLYAMFIADACIRGEDVRGWNIEKLHESVLEHYKNVWSKSGINDNNLLDKKHINLLMLATITNGVDITSSKYDDCLDITRKRLKALDILPSEHEFENDKYHILSDEQT
jgi:hypothetical protein